MGDCQNCGSSIEYEYQIGELLFEMLSNSKDKEEVKEYLDTEFDWSINQACGVCYHTYWVPEEEKHLWYDILEKL